MTEFPEEDEDLDEYNTEETMTEESGEEENDTRKVKVMVRKAKGALKSKGKVRSLMDFHNGFYNYAGMLLALDRWPLAT